MPVSAKDCKDLDTTARCKASHSLRYRLYGCQEGSEDASSLELQKSFDVACFLACANPFVSACRGDGGPRHAILPENASNVENICCVVGLQQSNQLIFVELVRLSPRT